MARQWVSTAAGAHLRGRSKVGTRPEIALRQALRKLGVGYRVQFRIAQGCTPDVTLLGPRIAVFVDGCFWHGCPRHGRNTFYGPNADLWVQKMNRNRERDVRSTKLAHNAGFAVLRLWECDVLAAPEQQAALLRQMRDAAS